MKFELDPVSKIVRQRIGFRFESRTVITAVIIISLDGKVATRVVTTGIIEGEFDNSQDEDCLD